MPIFGSKGGIGPQVIEPITKDVLIEAKRIAEELGVTPLEVMVAQYLFSESR